MAIYCAVVDVVSGRSGVRGPLSRLSASNPRPLALSPEYAQQQRSEENHDKDEKQDLGNLGCATRNAAKAKECRDDRDDEEDDSVTKHEALQKGRLSVWFACWLTLSPCSRFVPLCPRHRVQSN